MLNFVRYYEEIVGLLKNILIISQVHSFHLLESCRTCSNKIKDHYHFTSEFNLTLHVNYALLQIPHVHCWHAIVNKSYCTCHEENNQVS